MFTEYSCEPAALKRWCGMMQHEATRVAAVVRYLVSKYLFLSLSHFARWSVKVILFWRLIVVGRRRQLGLLSRTKLGVCRSKGPSGPQPRI